MLKNIYLILLILCSFSLSAQLLDVDFDADPTGTITTTPGGDYYWIDNGACGSDWEVTTGIGSVTCSSCSGNLAGIQYGISGCFLDATLVVGPFSPTGTCVDISFDYGYTTTTATTGDDFRVELYDNSGTIVSVLVAATTSDVDGSYSQQICGLIGGQNYTIRARHKDLYNAWGSEVDNFLVTEPCATTATYTTVDDCANSQFYIDVNVTSLGAGTNINITNNGGAGASNSAGTGITQIGPFSVGTNVTVIVDGTSFGGCAITSTTLSATCVTSSSQDCSGGTSICGDAVFSGNSNGPGPIDDIDGTTGGCLGINENESSWYFFEALTAGKLEFAIKPQNGTDDYDFALWGPYPSGSTPASICPPAGPPIRCSFAAGAPNPLTGTGLVTGAGDTSEGTGGDDIVDPIFPNTGDVYILLVDNYAATTSPFNMDMTLSSGLSLNCTTLPIELLNFNGYSEEGYNRLEWVTASELNNDRFIIEKSHDGVLFNVIGDVEGQSNSNNNTDYSFIDDNINDGIFYYRLRQVDFDGSYTYSNTIAIKQSENAEISFFPNPTKGNVKLNFVSKHQEQITITVSSLFQKIHKQQVSFPRGNHVFDLDIFKELKPGFYIINAIDDHGNIIKTQRIIKN